MTERFNPYMQFISSLVPNWIMERQEISPGAKLCYARLCQYCGRNGDCFPFKSVLAKEMGVSEDSAGRYTKELEAFNLIQVVKRGFGQSNTYFFLVHEWMDAAIPMRKPDGPELANMPATYTADMPATYVANMPATITPHTIDEENQLKDQQIEKNQRSLIKSKKEISSDAKSLTQELIRLMVKEDPKAKIPQNLDAWESDADKLLRLDGRPLAQALKVLQWAKADNFWSQNILSMKKFRHHYPRLGIAYSKPQGKWGKALPKKSPELQDLTAMLNEERPSV